VGCIGAGKSCILNKIAQIITGQKEPVKVFKSQSSTVSMT
jgi:ABC-type nitrate/sulfonate/bicarbonate transport system ATPase subunit